MTDSGTLKLSALGDREIVTTRTFDAPRRLVFDAFSKPELVRQWLLGPPGWTMPVCEIEFRVVDKYRYVWRNTARSQFPNASSSPRSLTSPGTPARRWGPSS